MRILLLTLSLMLVSSSAFAMAWNPFGSSEKTYATCIMDATSDAVVEALAEYPNCQNLNDRRSECGARYYELQLEKSNDCLCEFRGVCE